MLRALAKQVAGLRWTGKLLAALVEELHADVDDGVPLVLGQVADHVVGVEQRTLRQAGAEVVDQGGDALARLGVGGHHMDDEACAIAGLRWLDDDR